MDGLEEYVISTNHDKYGRVLSTTIQGISTTDDIKNAVDKNLFRANQHLTNESIYEIYYRAGRIIADNERKSGLSKNEIRILKSVRKEMTISTKEKFAKDYDLKAGELPDLGRAFPTRRGDATSFVAGANSNTHQLFIASNNSTLSKAATGKKNYNADFVTGSTDGSTGGTSYGIGKNTTSFISTIANDYIKEFKEKNDLNVVLVDRIDITIPNNDNRNQWNAVQTSLRSLYPSANVTIKVDPDVQKRLHGQSAGKHAAGTQADINIYTSGVSDEHKKYANRDVQ